MAIAKQNRAVRLGGWLVCVGAVTGGVIGYMQASGNDLGLGGIGIGVAALLASAVMGLSFAVGAIWMRSIDEAAQEAHKSAWYWGGSVGMSVGGVFLILSLLPGAERIPIPTYTLGSNSPAAYAATGAFAMLTLMLIGYGVVWAWWWLSRTRG